MTLKNWVGYGVMAVALLSWSVLVAAPGEGDCFTLEGDGNCGTDTNSGTIICPAPPEIQGEPCILLITWASPKYKCADGEEQDRCTLFEDSVHGYAEEYECVEGQCIEVDSYAYVSCHSAQLTGMACEGGVEPGGQ